jgi:hypothetical protein
MGPRAGLKDVENLTFLTIQGLELQSLGRPARSESLYRLRYRGSLPQPTTQHAPVVCRVWLRIPGTDS